MLEIHTSRTAWMRFIFYIWTRLLATAVIFAPIRCNRVSPATRPGMARPAASLHGLAQWLFCLPAALAKLPLALHRPIAPCGCFQRTAVSGKRSGAKALPGILVILKSES